MQVTTQHILIYGICYFSFLVAEKAAAKNNSHKLSAILFQNGSMDIWQLKTIYGLLILGSCTMYYLSTFSDISKNILQAENSVQNFCKMTIYLMAAVYLVSKRTLTGFCQHSALPVKNLIPFLALQTPFLVVYELFFRGVLLFGITEMAGPSIAIIFNCGLSMLVHSHEHKKDILCSFLTSVVLCVLCLDMQSVLPAVLIQLTTSLIFNIRLFRHSQFLNHP